MGLTHYFAAKAHQYRFFAIHCVQLVKINRALIDRTVIAKTTDVLAFWWPVLAGTNAKTGPETAHSPESGHPARTCPYLRT